MDIIKWCMDHEEEKRVYAWYSDNHYKITFESSDTYEYKRHELTNNKYQITIWINGSMESNAVYTDTWLENGNFGAKLTDTLPNTQAA